MKRRRLFLTFASWVGGDRDGHPLVTPEISLATAPDEVVDELKTIRAIQRDHGERAAHHFILSMTRSAADLSPVLAESIRLRNPYIDPLNYLQIRFLPRWRRAKENEKLRRLLALTVNGIAFGMKSTG